MMDLVEKCVSVRNLKTVADICFLFGSYVGWRTVSDEFACQGHLSRSKSFFGGFKVTRYDYELL